MNIEAASQQDSEVLKNIAVRAILETVTASDEIKTEIIAGTMKHIEANLSGSDGVFDVQGLLHSGIHSDSTFLELVRFVRFTQLASQRCWPSPVDCGAGCVRMGERGKRLCAR